MSGGQQLDVEREPSGRLRRSARSCGARTSWPTRASASSAAHAKWRITRVEHGFGLALGVQVGRWPQRAPRQNAGGRRRLLVLAAGHRREALRPEGPVPHRAQRRLPRALARRRRPCCRSRDGHVSRDGTSSPTAAASSWRVLEPLDLVGETYGTYLLASNADSGVKASNEAVGGIKVFVERNSYLMLGAGARYTNGFEAADVRALPRLHLRAVHRRPRRRRHQGRRRPVPRRPRGLRRLQGRGRLPRSGQRQRRHPRRRRPLPQRARGPRRRSRTRTAAPRASDGDRDGDGIPDSKDKCPDDPEDRDGFQDEDGCPDPDNDKDGIPDKMDQCPNDPEDKDGFEDQDGCPDPDNDHDGIPDVTDKCPNEPETFNGFEDEDGCPDKGSVIIQDNNIVILDKIQFAYNSAEILPASNKILDAVATTLNHHPEFTLLEVAGHADERGSDQYNLHLTQDRVNSVMRALIARGVEKSRLRSKGYGEFCPLDPGHNEAAWEQNRRVEFKIRQDQGRPHGRRARVRERDGARRLAGSRAVAISSKLAPFGLRAVSSKLAPFGLRAVSSKLAPFGLRASRAALLRGLDPLRAHGGPERQADLCRRRRCGR